MNTGYPRKLGGVVISGGTAGIWPPTATRFETPEGSTFDLVLLDMMMPDFLSAAWRLLRKFVVRDRETPFFDPRLRIRGGRVRVTCGSKRSHEYFSKPWDNEKTSDRATADLEAPLERENNELKRALRQRYSSRNIVGKREGCSNSWTWWGQVRLAATILIHRETGHRPKVIDNAINALLGMRAGIRSFRCTPVRCRRNLRERRFSVTSKEPSQERLASAHRLFEPPTGHDFLREIGTISLKTRPNAARTTGGRALRLAPPKRFAVDVRGWPPTDAI